MRAGSGLLSLLGRMTQLGPMPGASEVEVESALMSRSDHAACYGLPAPCFPEPTPGGTCTGATAPFPASAAHIRPHLPHQSRKISAQFATHPGLASAQEVWFVKRFSGAEGTPLYSTSTASPSAHRGWALGLGSRCC